MNMAALIVLLVVTWSASLCASSMSGLRDGEEDILSKLNTQELNFQPLEDGLPWPLLDFGDITLLMTHAVHCVDVVQENKTDPFHQAHKAHCKNLVESVLEFFQSNPNYTVPDIICQDIRAYAFPSGRIRRGRWNRWRGKRSILPANPNAHRITQSDKFNTIASRNFGELIKKEQDGKATPQELAYLAQTTGPVFIRMAALGVYCRYEAYIDVLKGAIFGEPASIGRSGQ